MAEEAVRIVWDYDPAAPLATYDPSPPEVWTNHQRWRRLSHDEQQQVLAHELGHHYTGTLHIHPEASMQRANALRYEARANRKALLLRISDAEAAR